MKKFLSIALALLMVCVMLPVVALADEGITTEQALKDAITAATDGATITLGGDIDLSQTITVNKTITLNMNGKKLYNTSDLWDKPTAEAGNWSLISVRGSGNLTITGYGTFAAKENDCYAVDVKESATVTIKNGTFIGNIHAVYVFAGTANVEGGTSKLTVISPFSYPSV